MNKNPETIKIVIADDHTIIRQGLAKVLDLAPHFELIGEASDGELALNIIRSLKPDIALLDIRMPKYTGIEVLQKLVNEKSSTKVLILTNYDDPEYILDAISEGAQGYVLKTIDPNSLIQSIEAIYEGEIVLDPTIASLVAKTWRNRKSPELDIMGINALTIREKETLELACNGLRNKEISNEMGISVRTVEGHFNRIFSKLEVSSRTEAVLLAVSEKH
jgi:two-component system response regulator DegU